MRGLDRQTRGHQRSGYERRGTSPPPLALHSAYQLDDGYLLSYQSSFDRAAAPPQESRLVVVNFDGTVRELSFKKGQ